MPEHDDLMQCSAGLMQLKEGLRSSPDRGKSNRSQVKGPQTKAQGLIGLSTAKYIKFEI